MRRKKILLVIPAYNEEKNILKTCKKIVEYNGKYNTKYDILVINDGSKDKTGEICKKNNIPYISLIYNLGIGGAVQTGYKYALDNGYDIVVQFDGDGQHDIKYVDDIVNPILSKEADMVIGSRFVEDNFSHFKSSKTRRLGIRMISFFIKLVTEKKIFDTTSGFRAVNTRIINEFSKDYPVEYPEPVSIVKILQRGYMIKEVPVNMNERKNGISSITSWKSIYYMINVILSVLLLWIGGKNEH